MRRRYALSRKNDFWGGLRGGLPIGLGYFAVSLAIGLYWAKASFPPLSSAFFSAFNMSSTGEFAGITIMAKHLGVLELAATTLLVNLRYLLMSISLSQRLEAKVGTGVRLLMALGVTDEIYALNITRPQLGLAYYFGSMVLPVIGWTSGTLIGALTGEVIPKSLENSAGILLYAMFIAIVIPPARHSPNVRKCVLVAMVVSPVLFYVPYLSDLQVGWRLIIATVFTAALAATLWPVSETAIQSQDGKLNSPNSGSKHGGEIAR